MHSTDSTLTKSIIQGTLTSQVVMALCTLVIIAAAAIYPTTLSPVIPLSNPHVTTTSHASLVVVDSYTASL